MGLEGEGSRLVVLIVLVESLGLVEIPSCICTNLSCWRGLPENWGKLQALIS